MTSSTSALTPSHNEDVPQCRSPAHCIEWAKLIAWTSQRAGEDFDADVEEHMRWVYERALARAERFGIQAGCFDVWVTRYGRCLTCGGHIQWV